MTSWTGIAFFLMAVVIASTSLMIKGIGITARSRFDHPAGRHLTRILSLGLVAWPAGVVTAALFHRLPPVPVLVPITVLIAVGIYFSAPAVRSLLLAVPSHWVIGIQVFRITGAILLVLGLGDTIPARFGIVAGSGDVVVGLAAIPIALAVRDGRRHSRAAALAWNVAGLADFAIALGLGMLVVREALLVQAQGEVTADPGLAMIAFPIVLIPVLRVPTGTLLHFLSIRQLARARPASLG